MKNGSSCFLTAHLASKHVYELNNFISIFCHSLLVVLNDNALLHMEVVDLFVSINRHQ